MVTPKQTVLVSLLLFTLLSWWHLYLPGISNPNERIRFFLAHSIATDGRFSVDKEIRHYGGSIDRSRLNGHTYCDKAPMLSFFGVPALFVLHSIIGAFPSESIALKVLKLTTVIPFAILLFWLIFVIIHRESEQTKYAFAAAFATIFSTPLFTWFQVYFSHAVAAALLLLFYYLHTLCRQRQYRSSLCFWAGIVGGITFWTEYTTAFALAVISLFSLFSLISQKDTKRCALFIGGAALVALPFFIHNTFIFGGPFSLGYSHLAEHSFAVGQSKGLFGITVPTMRAVLTTLFSFRIGIVTLSPMLIFALFTVTEKKNLERWVVVVVHFVVVTSFTFWDGGGSFGSRHMMSVYPFIALLAFRGFTIVRRKHNVVMPFAALALFSAFLFTSISVIFPFFAPKFTNPAATFFLPMVRERFFPNSSILAPLIHSGTVQYAVWIGIVLIMTSIALYILFNRSLFKTTVVVLTALSFYMALFIPFATDKNALWDAYMSMEKVEHKVERKEKELLLKGVIPPDLLK